MICHIPVFSAIISKVPSINPYPAAAWFLVALTVVYGIFFVCIYTESETFCLKCREACNSLQSEVGKYSDKIHVDVRKKRKCSLKKLTVSLQLLCLYNYGTLYNNHNYYCIRLCY